MKYLILLIGCMMFAGLSFAASLETVDLTNCVEVGGKDRVLKILFGAIVGIIVGGVIGLLVGWPMGVLPPGIIGGIMVGLAVSLIVPAEYNCDTIFHTVDKANIITAKSKHMLRTVS